MFSASSPEKTPQAEAARLAEEAELAQLAAAGDGQAFATLYDRYERSTYNFCLRLTGSRDDAADVTQEAFLQMLERLPDLEGRELNFPAYVLTIARRASYRTLKRRRRATPTEAVPEMATGGGAPDPGDPEGDPERRVLLEAQQREISAANAKLPERQREVLALRELQELSYAEIGTILEMKPNAVAQLISRARIKLRDELRGTALASIASTSPECERALPLLAMRQDRQLKSAKDAAWLEHHLTKCGTCRTSREAMEEAGVSYRAWLPIAALPWMRDALLAKAAEAFGANWIPPNARVPSLRTRLADRYSSLAGSRSQIAKRAVAVAVVGSVIGAAIFGASVVGEPNSREAGSPAALTDVGVGSISDSRRGAATAGERAVEQAGAKPKTPEASDASKGPSAPSAGAGSGGQAETTGETNGSHGAATSPDRPAGGDGSPGDKPDPSGDSKEEPADVDSGGSIDPSGDPESGGTEAGGDSETTTPPASTTPPATTTPPSGTTTTPGTTTPPKPPPTKTPPPVVSVPPIVKMPESSGPTIK